MLCLLISMVIVIYILSQNFILKIETFEDVNPFIGINNRSPDELVFYHTSNTSNDKYNIIKSPNGRIIDYVYEKKILVILTADYKIYYCDNCNLFLGNVNWTQLKHTFTTINSISLDTETTNKVVILTTSGEIWICDDFISYKTNVPVTDPQWVKIVLPTTTGDSKFKFMDAQYGSIVGIGNNTNFIYYKSLNDAKKNKGNWTILDKSRLMTSIKITLNGYYGKSAENEIYRCDFPCKGSGVDKWTKLDNRVINDPITNSINANRELLSIMRNNSVYSCDKNTCSRSNLLQESSTSKYYLDKGKLLDFVYPELDRLSKIDPLPTNEVANMNKQIDEYNANYDKVKQALVKVEDKISKFNTEQNKFNVIFESLSKQREQIIKTLIHKIGVKQEGFENISIPRPTLPPVEPIDFSKIKQKIQSKISSRKTDPTPQISTNDSIIISV